MQSPTPLPQSPRAGGWAKGDPRAKEAGAKGAATRRRNLEQGRAPSSAKGRKDSGPRRAFGAVGGIASKTRARITALVGTGVVALDSIAARVVATPTWSWAEEHLEPFEVKLLTEAIVSTAIRYPKLVKRLEQAGVAADFAAIPMAALVIALPRLVAHGVVPEGMKSALEPLLAEARKGSPRLSEEDKQEVPPPFAEDGPFTSANGDQPPDRAAPAESPIPGVEALDPETLREMERDRPRAE